MMSTPSLLMRSPATVAARFESDCESLMMMLIGCTAPSAVAMPSLTAAFHWSTQNWSASPNAASGPVSGETKPILISRPSPSLALSLVSPPPQAAATAPSPPVAPSASPATPAVLRKSRRESGVRITDSVPLLVLSSELIPPPYVVPPPPRSP